MAKNTSNKTGKKIKKRKKKLPRSLIIAVVCLFVLPAVALLVWYFTTVSLAVSGSNLSPSEMVAANIAKAREALRDRMAERALLEKFDVEDVNSCINIEDQYQVARGEKADLITKRLLGLSSEATFKQMNERCVVFAKVVVRMERLAHHERHVFICEDASFSNDDSGRFALMADAKGRGVIEAFSGRKKLIKIPRGSHSLLREWQIFNLGDGCIIIGFSELGVLKMFNSVQIQ